MDLVPPYAERWPYRSHDHGGMPEYPRRCVRWPALKSAARARADSNAREFRRGRLSFRSLARYLASPPQLQFGAERRNGPESDRFAHFPVELLQFQFAPRLRGLRRRDRGVTGGHLQRRTLCPRQSSKV